jgi:hypothetical protein
MDSCATGVHKQSLQRPKLSLLLLLLLLQALHELAGGDVAAAGGGRGGPSSLQQEALDFVQQQSMVVSHLNQTQD